MNKKDVLGARPAAGIIQKMKSIPYLVQCWKCSFSGTQINRERREVLAVSDYRSKQKLKRFNYFSLGLNLQIDCVFMFDCVCNHFVTIVTLL